MKKNITILLIEDETLIREGIKSLLQKESYIGQIYEAGSRGDVWKCPLNEINVVLLDFRLRDCNALDLIPKLKENTQAKLIVVTGFEGSELVINLLRAGVHSIVQKLEGYHEIRVAMHRVLEGDTYYPAHVVKIIQARAHNWDSIPPITLSFSENEMLAAISSGLTTKQIAVQLKMTEATTETYRLRLIKKLGVPNTAAMMAYAFRNGIL